MDLETELSNLRTLHWLKYSSFLSLLY